MIDYYNVFSCSNLVSSVLLRADLALFHLNLLITIFIIYLGLIIFYNTYVFMGAHNFEFIEIKIFRSVPNDFDDIVIFATLCI